MGGSSGGGGSSNTTQTTTNTPWSGVQKPLKNIYSRADQLYNSGDLGALGPESAYTQLARGLAANRALSGGYGITDSAVGVANDTLQGNYLYGNPYQNEAIRYAQQPVIDAFNQDVAPSIDATFARAGGLGSGAYAAARNRAEDTLARNLAGSATQAGYQNFQDERTRQTQMAAFAPQLENAGYSDIDRLATVGAQEDARAQAEASQQQRALQTYASLINASPIFSNSTTSGTQSGGGGGSNNLATGLGAALSLGSLFFCDERLKTDIKRVGRLDTGEGVYTFRYKGGKTVHMGVMAQEIEENYPDAVSGDHIKAVNYAHV